MFPLFLSLLSCNSPAPPEPVAPTEVEMVASMEEHYSLAIAAHDAALRGDETRLKQKLESIATLTPPPKAPEAWGALHANLTSAAKEGASASGPEATSAVMGKVARACGRCHETLGKGPRYPAPGQPDPSAGLAPEMRTHQWATERLWEGVTGPWDLAWERGTSALAQRELFDDGAPAELVAHESALRDLATEAQAAPEAERSQAYARLIATCAGCHDAAGVAFPAPDEPQAN